MIHQIIAAEKSIRRNEERSKANTKVFHLPLWPLIMPIILGDVQCVFEQRVVVGPARGDIQAELQTFSINLFDLQAESVVGLFCGSQSKVSIEKQYCVESHNVIFSSDDGVGFVWDVRTFRPSIMLHHDCFSSRIMGVHTGSSGLFAFTFGDRCTEHIDCWDLRKPVSHVYRMATGNSNGRSLCWHDRTSSIIAATITEHTMTHGEFRSYMYGEPER
jgi:hypothetical protein